MATSQLSRIPRFYLSRNRDIVRFHGDVTVFVERTYELAAALGDDLVNHPDHHGTAAQQKRAPGKRIVLSRPRPLTPAAK